MNRSNVGRQMVGDLSRLVGRNVGDQFSNKNQAYADGDVVRLGPDLAEVSYTDVFGKVKKYQYNPNTHDKPQPSGRMRKLSTDLGGTADYKNAALLPGQRFFDYLTPVSVEAELVSAPVSIAPPKKEISEGSGGNEKEDLGERGPLMTNPNAVKDRLDQVKTMAGIIGFLPGGSFLGPLFAKYGIDDVKDSLLETADLENQLGYDDEGNVKDDPGLGTAAGLLATGKIDFDDSSQAGKVEGAAKGITAQQNMTAFGLSTDEDGNVTRGSEKVGLTLNDLAENTMTREDLASFIDSNLDPAVDTSMTLFGGNNPDYGNLGIGFEAPDLGSFDPDNPSLNAVNFIAQQTIDSLPNNTGSDDDDTFSFSSEDLEGFGGMDDFGGFGAAGGAVTEGGITSLYGGGPAEAPADRPLDAGSFVVSADVVSGVGDGSTESGIERLSGLLGIPLDGSVDGPNGTMAGRVTTADGGPVPGTGLSDSINTVITGASGGSVNTYARGLSVNNPLQQATRSGTTAARIARDEIVIPTTALAKLPVMFGGDKKPNLAKGQQMMTNFMENVRARKTNTGGEQPGPLVPEGESVVKGLSSLMFKRPT
jgi:hypothetical protein